MNAEREQLRASLLRQLTACPADDAWKRLGDAGVVALAVPEQFGGLGLGLADAAPVLDVLGELCLPCPFLETSIIAVSVLNRAGQGGRAGLEAIAHGGAIAALCGIEDDGVSDVRARREGSGWRLDGTARVVLDALSASLFLIRADAGGDAPMLFLMDRFGESVRTRAFPTIDGRQAADVSFHDTPLPESACIGPAPVLLAEATDHGVAALAVEAAALMRRLVHDTVDYAKQRIQFDQPIARFQVVQHRLVDMHMAARRAAAAAERAIASSGADARTRAREASAAKVTICRTGRFIGQNAVQLHGGMGLTNELPVSRYFKRLTVIESQLGSADDHLRRYMAMRDAA